MSELTVGYLQLVHKDLTPVNGRAAVLTDWRPDFASAGGIEITMYSRDRRVQLHSDGKVAKVGLFTPDHQLLTVCWDIFCTESYTMEFPFYDPDRQLHTTFNTTARINQEAERLIREAGL